MKRVMLLAAIAVMVCAIGAFAQGRPNFSGTWVLDPAKSDMGGGPAGGGARGGGGMGTPAPVKITQTATEMTVEQTMGQNVTKTVYKFDGSESVNEGPRGTTKIKSKWEGNKLVSTIVRETQRGAMESTETRSLAADGTMVVETTSNTPNGPMTRKMVYNKQ